ncbi:MAG: SNF2-related protein [Patescibacteria group bacterium]|nr:SNF2-related protein [Patescibacteria group bacterium]
MSQIQRLYLSHKLTEKKSISDPEKLNNIIRTANIDLNSHQVDAAVFAFKSPLSRGAILADEVGLGKTIEAGLIINELWVEGRQHILILVPASLRTQWQDELKLRFNLDSYIVDAKQLKVLQDKTDKLNPLTENGIYIASHNFAYRYDKFVKDISWDLVAIDEAHRLRNVWRKKNKVAKKIKEAIQNRPKVLMTATPLQNNLMELFGLTSFLEDNYLGTEYSFKTLFVNPVKRQKRYDSLAQLKERLMGNFENGEVSGGILTRTLRKQVRGFVNFTNRFSHTEDFAPNDDEILLYESVSEYLRRPVLASTRATQRNMMELVYRKILASSSFAIAGTLEKIVHFLAKRLQQELEIDFEEVQAYVQQVKIEIQNKIGKALRDIDLKPIEVVKDLIQETLPGMDDIEAKEEEIQEETQDADDLGEDEQMLDGQGTKKEREVDHKFTKEEILSELKDVMEYYYLACGIDVNQKSQALVRVLKKVFNYADKQQWPQKAVIFTESRRTQDHLEKLLIGNGYDLILFNGTNASKRSKEIYAEWEKLFLEEAAKGSKSINIRKALVWKFKELSKAILITTEAGAEGLNLQFANIVINYDLPWNPQRIEQRIGRCHRYGQKLDVLVVNFLNRKNYADQRVYELLQEKIKLFGNLFDFSDKVLGTEKLTDDGYEVREVALAGLGTGLDFERKILEIYRQCRTEQQIEKGFKQLQLDLGDIIEEKIEDTQKKVIQHFDEEVRQKLKIRQQTFEEALSKFDARLKTYLSLALGSAVSYTDNKILEYAGGCFCLGRITEAEREKGLLPINLETDFVKQAIEQDKKIIGSWVVSMKHPEDHRKILEDYVGLDGQISVDVLNCSRKTINNTEENFEKIIVSAMVNKDGQWQKIEPKRAEKIFELRVTQEQSLEQRLRDELVDLTQKNVSDFQQEIIAENEGYVDQEMQNLDRFVEESLLKNKEEIDLREQELKEISKKLRGSSPTSGFHERQQILEEKDKKQKELFKAQSKYIKMQQEQFLQKDQKVMDLRNKLQMTFEHKNLAKIQFKILS